MSGGACWRVKRLLFGRWLAAPPAAPTLHVSSTASTLDCSFEYTPPGPYNADDCFELQARGVCRCCAQRVCSLTRPQLLPTAPELVKALGDALDWCTFYHGNARTFSVDMLPGACASVFGTGRCD